MDKLLASGRERKDALQSVPEAAARLRSLGAAYTSAFEAEGQAVSEERRRMAVAIPGLSKQAEEALARLTAAAQKDGRPLNAAAGSLDPDIRREFAVVSRALDERFGRNAILREEKDLLNRVPASQRRAFEAMRERLKVLQQAVRIDSSQKIISERRARVINRAHGIDV